MGHSWTENSFIWGFHWPLRSWDSPIPTIIWVPGTESLTRGVPELQSHLATITNLAMQPYSPTKLQRMCFRKKRENSFVSNYKQSVSGTKYTLLLPTLPTVLSNFCFIAVDFDTDSFSIVLAKITCRCAANLTHPVITKPCYGHEVKCQRLWLCTSVRGHTSGCCIEAVKWSGRSEGSHTIFKCPAT